MGKSASNLVQRPLVRAVEMEEAYHGDRMESAWKRKSRRTTETTWGCPKAKVKAYHGDHMGLA